jgi:hypothetical protein
MQGSSVGHQRWTLVPEYLAHVRFLDIFINDLGIGEKPNQRLQRVVEGTSVAFRED